MPEAGEQPVGLGRRPALPHHPQQRQERRRHQHETDKMGDEQKRKGDVQADLSCRGTSVEGEHGGEDHDEEGDPGQLAEHLGALGRFGIARDGLLAVHLVEADEHDHPEDA
jgi:hypothetical protein